MMIMASLQRGRFPRRWAARVILLVLILGTVFPLPSRTPSPGVGIARLQTPHLSPSTRHRAPAAAFLPQLPPSSSPQLPCGATLPAYRLPELPAGEALARCLGDPFLMVIRNAALAMRSSALSVRQMAIAAIFHPRPIHAAPGSTETPGIAQGLR